jgi:hypothetical protein
LGTGAEGAGVGAAAPVDGALADGVGVAVAVGVVGVVTCCTNGFLLSNSSNE